MEGAKPLVNKGMKPYIYPESQFDPQTVPVPWFDATSQMDTKEKATHFERQMYANIEWVYENLSWIDEEDGLYLLLCLHRMGNPLWRHEFMNFFIIAKLAITKAKKDGSYKS